MTFFLLKALAPFCWELRSPGVMVEGGSAFTLAVPVLPPGAERSPHGPGALKEAACSFIYMTWVEIE